MNENKNSITIKKYANRRLYNTATSSYVTLEDLSVMVKNGEKFNVYDAKSSEDITRSVLTQIIVEEENKTGQQNLLPINFLRQLISFYGGNMQWMVPKYLEHSMEVLTGNQDQIQDYFKNTVGSMFPFGSTFEEMSKQNLSMFENTMRMLSPFTLASSLKQAQTSAAPAQQAQATNEASSNSNNNNNNSNSNKTKAKQAASTADVSVAPTPSVAAAPTATPAPTQQSCTLATTTSAPATPVQQAKVVVNEEPKVASVTNLKPRKEAQAEAQANQSDIPMTNVVNAASNNSGADDMQQKIANLQRQLADLAKSRA